jgi:hypothetical protein
MNTGIVGSKNLSHIRENIAAAERGPLPTDVYAEVVRRLTDVGIVPEQIDMEKGDQA